MTKPVSLTNAIGSALAALEAARITFRYYESQHLAKSPPDTTKARRNRDMAETMEIAQGALSAAGNPFTPVEAERLVMLAEENAEAIKAVCKALRQGYASDKSDDPDAADGSRGTPSDVNSARESTTALKLLNVNEAAAHLGISTSYLNKKRIYGGGPAFMKIGASVKYALSDLAAWAESQKRRSTSDTAGATVRKSRHTHHRTTDAQS